MIKIRCWTLSNFEELLSTNWQSGKGTTI